jgi:site-specific DNA recombinase
MKRAAIYARVSVEDKENPEASTDTQIRVCRERATAEGLTVVATYKDIDVSGGIPPNLRPQGAHLIAARDAHEFDVLIVSEPTRLYRSDALPAELRRWTAEEVRVVFAGNEIDMANSDWELSAGIHGVMGQHYRRMISVKTHAALASRALRRSWTGGKPYGYDNIVDGDRKTLKIKESQRPIVVRIFDRYLFGVSADTIATELNDDKVGSPGSTWDRTERRRHGWMGSTVRVILANPIYKGEVRWNTSKWKRNEESGRTKRKERAQAEWDRYTYQDDKLQIVTPTVWDAAQARTQQLAKGPQKERSGGKLKYLLSNLLGCKVCGRSFVMHNATHYSCASSKTNACTNRMSVRRDDLEAHVLPVIQIGLLDPKLVDAMARELQREYNRLVAELDGKAARRPAEVKALDERIARLRVRLREGDDDLTAEELTAVLDRAIAKRAELMADRPELRQTAKVLTMLPKAAEAYRRQIAAGLEGNPRETAQARAVIRQLVGGKIWLAPDAAAGHLVAEFGLNRVALLRAAGALSPRKDQVGSGGRI